MKYIFKNRIISIIVLSIILLQSFSYAKDTGFSRQEFAHPESTSKDINISENAIIYENPYKEYGPLNDTPIGIDKTEYDSVDNFNIDLKTIETRIKYFSPAYLSIKKGAESSYWMAFYARGGSLPNMNELRDSCTTYLYKANEYKLLYDQARNELSELKKIKNPDAETQSKIALLTYKCAELDAYYKGMKGAYSTALSTVGSLMAQMGYRRALVNVANVDANNQVTFARETITKNLISAVTSFMALDSYMEVLQYMMDKKYLYDDMLASYMYKSEIGYTTELDAVKEYDAYEKARIDYETTKTLYNSIKQQICVNLGYDLADIDKLNFIEPEPDFEYIYKINIDEDRDKAYNSNAAYKSITLSAKDKKLPGSTGEVIFNRKRKSTAEKVIVELEKAYGNLQAALISYEGSKYLKEVSEVSDGMAERMEDVGIVDYYTYIDTKIQSRMAMVSVKQSKYDLINATNNYYYGTRGQLNVS